MARRRSGIAAIAMVATLAGAVAGTALGHDDHELDDAIPLCVLVLTDDPPADWHGEDLVEGLADGSLTIVGIDPEECHDHESTASEAPSEEAVEAWRVISGSVFAEQIDWEELIVTGGVGMSEQDLQDVQARAREYLAVLDDVGPHPCYADIHAALLQSATTMDAALTDLAAGRTTRGWLQLDEASDGLYDYWFELERGICEP